MLTVNASSFGYMLSYLATMCIYIAQYYIYIFVGAVLFLLAIDIANCNHFNFYFQYKHDRYND